MQLSNNSNYSFPNHNSGAVQRHDEAQLASTIARFTSPSQLSARSYVTAAGPRLGGTSVATYWSELNRLVDLDAGLRQALAEVAAKSAGQYLLDVGAEPQAVDDFAASLSRGDEAVTSRGGTVVRTFFWGFHIQVSHQDLEIFIASAAAVNTIVGAIGGSIPSPAAPWIRLAATFISTALAALQGLDRGKGVYISMSWFAPGVFVPTPV